MKRIEQKEQRRNAILIKSMELFVTKGYHETKISDIAKSVNMSVGLLFHYFGSKEDLYYELVKMGVEGTKSPEKLQNLAPDEFFKETLRQIFSYSQEQPWIFQMFVLMDQAKREGTPERVRQLANSMQQIEFSAQIIQKGQATGIFKAGDPLALSACFWASVQGVMEQIATGQQTTTPDPEWLVSILTK